MADVVVTGGEQLRLVGQQLRAAGSVGGGLRRELLASMRVLEKPLTDMVRQSADDTLPRRGGLNTWVSKSNITFRNNLTGSASRIGARIVATKGKHDLFDADDGSISHPVFGHRDRWVSQRVTPGWFSMPLDKAVPAVTVALTAAVEATLLKLEKGF